jgi:flagella synthesis protein FlgN
MAESPVPAELAQTVDSEIAAAQCFLAFLEREQQMLVKGEVDDLLDLVRQKNKVAAELATLAARRSRLLAASGVASDGAGIAAWFAAHPEETGTRDAWSSLLAVAAQARELNRVNGELIQERLQSNAQALEALLGSNAAAGNLYGPDGQSAPPSTRRISDSA